MSVGRRDAEQERIDAGAERTILHLGTAVSAVVGAFRELLSASAPVPAYAAWPLHRPVWSALGWCVVLLAVTVPLAGSGSYRTVTGPSADAGIGRDYPVYP
ncbi:hypothetical protein [Rhodococcus gordoniae]|uniref:hypothetical protein n=1 Tax=Rhodococcus gordoniae TaxID=223392 RepID=UPI0020CBF24F|nr:hypothetical protein [Rhodococcus gordoniae]UTT47842.1 hypothetical protein NMQ04_16580 [Rhodococcus gordoniae]